MSEDGSGKEQKLTMNSSRSLIAVFKRWYVSRTIARDSERTFSCKKVRSDRLDELQFLVSNTNVQRA